MSWFVKTESFTLEAQEIPAEKRREYIKKHIEWTKELKSQGINFHSGYLTNKNKVPGGGGLFILQAESYEEAEQLIKDDPIIAAGIVNWKLQEWILISGEIE